MKRNLLLISGYPFLATLFLVSLYLLLSTDIIYSAMIVSVLALYILALFVLYIIYARYLKQEFWDNIIIRVATALTAIPLIYCVAFASSSPFDMAFYSSVALSVVLIALKQKDIAFFTLTIAVILKVYMLTQEYFSLLSYALTPYHIAYIARDISLVFLLLAATKKHGNTGSRGYKKYGFISAFYIFAQTASHLPSMIINNEVYEAFQSEVSVSIALIAVASVLALADGGMKKEELEEDEAGGEGEEVQDKSFGEEEFVKEAFEEEEIGEII